MVAFTATRIDFLGWLTNKKFISFGSSRIEKIHQDFKVKQILLTKGSLLSPLKEEDRAFVPQTEENSMMYERNHQFFNAVSIYVS